MQYIFFEFIPIPGYIKGIGFIEVAGMSKKIHIIRHGKAEPFGLVSSDFQRTLAPRGAADAKKAGIELRKRGAAPGLLISSPAPRALYTLRLIAEELKLDPESIITDSAIYEGDTDDLLGVVRAFPDTVEEAMFCGHNPGVSELAGRLYGEFCHGMATAEVITLVLETDSWSNAGACACQLTGRISSDRRD